MSSDVVKLKELIEMSKEFGLDESPWFINGLSKLSLRWNQNLYEKMLSRILYNNRIQLLNTTFPAPITKDDLDAVNGPFKVGTIQHTNLEFGFTPLQLQMHGVIGGQSGFGKTTLMMVLCDQLLAKSNILVWIIDPKGDGGDFRFLAKKFGNVVVLQPDTIKCNPFTRIDGVPFDMLREAVIEVTADSFGVFDASEGLIAKHIQKVMESHEYPTILDFYASIQSEKVGYGGRLPGYRDSVQTRLEKTIISLGNIIKCREDNFFMLFDKNVIFEIGRLSGSAQRQLVPWIILKLVLYKIMHPTKNLSHLLIFDEAQCELWSKNLEQRGRQSFMATLATQCRAYGLGLLVMAQAPSMKLMSDIIANSCTKLTFHLGSGIEIEGMARHMGLSVEQREVLYHLDRGEAICRVGLGYTDPLLLTIHPFQEQSVSSTELSEIMKPYWDMLLEKVEPVELAAKPVKPDIKTESQTQSQPEKTENTKTTIPAKATITTKNENESLSAINTPADLRSAGSDASSELSLEEQAYLRVISTHPWRLITEIYTLLNDEKVMGNARISKNNAVKIRQRLLKKKYIESVVVLGTGKSGKPQCDVLTEKSKKNTSGESNNHRGGNLHHYWVYRICQCYKRKSAVVKLSDTLNGYEVDLDVTVSGIRIGVEVVITSLVIENLKKNISTSYFDKVLILVIDEREREKFEGQIIKAGIIFNEKVEVGLLREYFVTM